MAKKVLIVEDEPELVQVLRDYFEQAGFVVEAAYDGPSGLSFFQHHQPDLVLLDLHLPGMDGLDVARAIRRDSDVPLIMITARVAEAERIVGLELGADDYVTKPFSPREVVARARAVLRRVEGGPQSPQILRSKDIEVDLTRRRVRVGGRRVDLTPTEFDLLACMIRDPGRVFSRMQLLECVQGEAFAGYERTIDTHIKNLRSKIEPDPRQPSYIETVFGVGYRFAEE
jgi:two-component system alkaline phosphatase synthesis response regulator PhoP